jgi:hypothetical protein
VGCTPSPARPRPILDPQVSYPGEFDLLDRRASLLIDPRRTKKITPEEGCPRGSPKRRTSGMVIFTPTKPPDQSAGYPIERSALSPEHADRKPLVSKVAATCPARLREGQRGAPVSLAGPPASRPARLCPVWGLFRLTASAHTRIQRGRRGMVAQITINPFWDGGCGPVRVLAYSHPCGRRASARRPTNTSPPGLDRVGHRSFAHRRCGLG